MVTMEKPAELLSGPPDIAGELVEQRRVGPEGDRVTSENRFGAAQSAQDAEGCTGASRADLATRCTSNDVVPLEKGDRFLLQLSRLDLVEALAGGHAIAPQIAAAIFPL
jgi:hypothetical protein